MGTQHMLASLRPSSLRPPLTTHKRYEMPAIAGCDYPVSTPNGLFVLLTPVGSNKLLTPLSPS